MEAILIELPSSSYVSIRHNGVQLDCAVLPGVSPADSLRTTALGLKTRIDRLTKQAAALQEAASQLDSRRDSTVI